MEAVKTIHKGIYINFTIQEGLIWTISTTFPNKLPFSMLRGRASWKSASISLKMAVIIKCRISKNKLLLTMLRNSKGRMWWSTSHSWIHSRKIRRNSQQVKWMIIRCRCWWSRRVGECRRSRRSRVSSNLMILSSPSRVISWWSWINRWLLGRDWLDNWLSRRWNRWLILMLKFWKCWKILIVLVKVTWNLLLVQMINGKSMLKKY